MENNGHFGLKKIFTDYESIKDIPSTELNDFLNDILLKYKKNRKEIIDLKKIYTGEQEILLREDDFKKSNQKVNANILPRIVETMSGLWLGEKIDYSLISLDNDENEQKQKDVMFLNRYLRNMNDILIDKDSIVEMLITGVAYQISCGNKNGILFENIESEDVFIIRKNEVGNPILASGVYFESKDNEGKHFEKVVIYDESKKYIYIKKENDEWIEESNVPHGCKNNPIQEFKRNNFFLSMVGQLEPLQNAFNITVSDSVNSIVDNVRSILFLMNAEIKEEDLKLVQENGILQANSFGEKEISAEFLNRPFDEGMSNIRDFLKEIMIFIAGMPRDGGGTSGNNMSAIIGSGLYIVNQTAYFNELEFRKPKRKLIENIIQRLKKEGNIKSDLDIDEIEFRFDRNRLTSLKENADAFSVLINAGYPYKEALKVTGFTNDIDLVSKEMERLRKETIDYTENKINEEISNGKNKMSKLQQQEN